MGGFLYGSGGSPSVYREVVYTYCTISKSNYVSGFFSPYHKFKDFTARGICEHYKGGVSNHYRSIK